MLEITPNLSLPMEEFSFTYARSGGPGGQNVNKVSSKVQLRWNPTKSPHLPTDVLARLLTQQKNRLTNEGDLLVVSQKTRDQGKNLQDCLDKVREIVVKALHVPKSRRPTKPTRGSKERRLSTKKIQAQRKQSRGRFKGDE